MEKFVRKYTSVPKKFIDDFFYISNENYRNNDLVIKFELVYEWLETDKSDLKKVLVKNFSEKIDYTIEKIKVKNRNRGSNYVDKIMITPDCFKHLCMISHTKKAKEVRIYYLELENIVKRYHDEIHIFMQKQIGILKNNQKPKINVKGGVLYILEAQNADDAFNEKKLYKIGKTTNVKKRVANYNTGNANNVDPVFILKVKDNLDAVENCVKSVCAITQYRKRKEVYEIDLDKLKEIMVNCDEMIESVKNNMIHEGGIFVKKLKKIGRNNNRKFYVMFDKFSNKEKSKSKTRSKNRKTTKRDKKKGSKKRIQTKD